MTLVVIFEFARDQPDDRRTTDKRQALMLQKKSIKT